MEMPTEKMMRDIDQIIQSIVTMFPMVNVRQLKVLHPGADDDGLWFFEQSGSEFTVQLESPEGMRPFLVETDENDARLTANSVEEAIRILVELLHLSGK
jgi:hypothetical protein